MSDIEEQEKIEKFKNAIRKIEKYYNDNLDSFDDDVTIDEIIESYIDWDTKRQRAG